MIKICSSNVDATGPPREVCAQTDMTGVADLTRKNACAHVTDVGPAGKETMS